MPDPLSKTWGPFKLSKTKISAADATVLATDKEQVFKLSTIDCYPAPQTNTEYVKPVSLSPSVKPNSLQASELTHFKNIKDVFGGTPKSLKGAQSIIEGELELESLNISYQSKDYKALRRLHPGFRNDIYLRVQYANYEIKVTALKAVTLGKVSFAAGDEIITYRAREPEMYRFESDLTWNKKCGVDKPVQDPIIKPTPYFMAQYKFEMEEIKVTGERLRKLRLSDGPASVSLEELMRLDKKWIDHNDPYINPDWSKFADELIKPDKE